MLDSKQLSEISKKGHEECLGKICKDFKEAEKILKKHAEMGFYNCTIICDREKIREFEQEAIKRNLGVYSYINEKNNGQLDIEWDYL
jgi:hypothetical protein